MSRDSIVAITAMLIRILRVANLLFGVAVAVMLVASFPAAGLVIDRLAAKYHGTVDPNALVWLMRALGVLGLVGVVVVARIFRELGEVLATLRAGDLFAPANAARFVAIGWALLAWQLLELGLGLVNWLVGRLGADNSTWAPSLGGWLAVLVAFVLARVFAAGSRMRHELATTI